MTKCLAQECIKESRRRGLCSTHWKVDKKYGTPNPKCFCGEPVQTLSGTKEVVFLCRQHFFEKRYWSNVKIKSENECWEWLASKTQFGYGVIGNSSKVKYAHRIALELVGIAIPEGLYACHKCDNPSCVNPNHLYVGTPQDNIDDQVNRGRSQRGERNGNARLSDNQVKEIRSFYSQGKSQKQIADMFNITQAYVSDIINNKARVA